MAPDDQENREPVLLSLFLEELSSLTRILFSELREATEELPRERIDALTRAVRAIRGAARVVGLPLAANLAYAMEESLVHSSLAGGRLMPPVTAPAGWAGAR